jgi:hypothetical protein
MFADGASDSFDLVAKLRGFLAEEGRSDGFGLQCNMLSDKSPVAVVERARRWRDAGGTHAAVVTMGVGLETAEQHVDYAKRVADALQSAGLPLT